MHHRLLEMGEDEMKFWNDANECMRKYERESRVMLN